MDLEPVKRPLVIRLLPIKIASKGSYSNGSSTAQVSLKALRRGLYQLTVSTQMCPFKESIGVLKTFQEEGKVRYIGLGEVAIEQLERAQRLVQVVGVQNEYNILRRQYEPVVDYCTQNGIVFIPWFLLGGLQGGARVVEVRLASLAAKYGVSSQQLALAWLLKRSPVYSAKHLEENLQAGRILLNSEDST